MAPNMGILKKFKSLEYTTHYADPESESSSSVASPGVASLALENEFRHNSLEFIVHSVLVRFS